MHLREATIQDIDAIRELYREVAMVEGGIARMESEITRDYVASFVSMSIKSGLIIVAEDPDNPSRLIAEVHGARNGLAVFSHVLGDVTLVVHPQFQKRKIGRTIFTIFLNEIAQHHPGIGKVELIVRETNTVAISLYQSLGFRIEGRLEMRIKTSESHYLADIPMGWQNPNYEF